MKKISLLLISISLAGCSTAYYNPYIKSAHQQQVQFQIDDGYCTSVSVGSVPMPEVRYYDSGTRIYTFNASSYSSSGAVNTIGTIQQRPSSADAFASGFANGAAIGDAIVASDQRNRVYSGCMASLGWFESKEVAQAAAREMEQSKANQSDQLAKALASTKYLKNWKPGEPRAEFAMDMDDKLRVDPAWSNRSLEDRFKEVERLTLIHFGDI